VVTAIATTSLFMCIFITSDKQRLGSFYESGASEPFTKEVPQEVN